MVAILKFWSTVIFLVSALAGSASHNSVWEIWTLIWLKNDIVSPNISVSVKQMRKCLTSYLIIQDGRLHNNPATGYEVKVLFILFSFMVYAGHEVLICPKNHMAEDWWLGGRKFQEKKMTRWQILGPFLALLALKATNKINNIPYTIPVKKYKKELGEKHMIVTCWGKIFSLEM